MNVVQLTTSGQISIPKALRMGFKTKVFTCEKTHEGILFKPLETPEEAPFAKKYTIKDLKKGIIAAPAGKKGTYDLAHHIDEIVYGL